MKKIIRYFPLLLLVGLSACTSRKDRLAADTLTITIDPSTAQTVSTGGTLALKAVCRSAKSDNVDISPTWSVESALGKISPTSGKSTTFTAGTTKGSGKIYVTYQNIRSSLDIIVGGYTLLADAGASTDLKSVSGSIMQYFDGGDGSIDSAPWTINVIDAAPGCSIDSAKCAKVAYTNGAGYWGGFYLEFNSAKDMSSYSKLTFYVKGDSGNEKFKIKMKDSSNVEAAVQSTDYITTTTSWQKVQIPLANFTGVNTASVSIPFVLAFEDSFTASNVTIYLDFIRFE